jgi:hypothetical protein
MTLERMIDAARHDMTNGHAEPHCGSSDSGTGLDNIDWAKGFMHACGLE